MAPNNYYLNNEDFLEEILKHQEKMQKMYDKYDGKENVPKDLKHGLHFMSGRLANMIMTLVKNNGHKRCYRKKEYLEDMVQQVSFDMMKIVKSFNIQYAIDNNKKPNPFGYFTQCITKAMNKFCDTQNKKFSQHNDYVIETALTEGHPDDMELIKEAIKPLVEARQEITGKWSIENMRKSTGLLPTKSV